MSVYPLDDREASILATFAALHSLSRPNASAAALAERIRGDTLTAYMDRYGEGAGTPPLRFAWTMAPPETVFELAGMYLYNAAGPAGDMYDLMQSIRKTAAVMIGKAQPSDPPHGPGPAYWE